MARRAHAQSGLTLMELLIALAIGALLAAPLGAMILNAVSARSVAGDMNDVMQQAQFAIQRMEAAVRRTAPHTLLAALPNSTGLWLTGVTFCQTGQSLRETDPLDIVCIAGRDIASNVTDFTTAVFDAGPGAGQVIELRLVLTGATGQSITLLSRTRLGGATL
jgi:prepilin-type N-terminal cleavage/methylation domain-containing protein